MLTLLFFFFFVLIGQLHRIKYGMKNTSPFQVVLDIKSLTKQNADCTHVRECISSSLQGWCTCICEALFNVLLGKQCQGDAVVNQADEILLCVWK